MSKKIKCGFVAVIGSPNAGKSSLVNAVVKKKVSIVSSRAQTTRNNILGIYNDGDSQIIFVDTPGISKIKNMLGTFMQKSIWGAVSGVDVICLVCDVRSHITDKDRDIIKNYHAKNIPVILVLTKIDLMTKDELFKKILKIKDLQDMCEIVPTSSKKGTNITTLISLIKTYLPSVDRGNRYFDSKVYTDKSLKFMMSDIIREKALYLLRGEVPHAVAVNITNIKDEDSTIYVDADLICEKESQRAIIIGRRGEMLKKIGHNARISIQKIVKKKVVLNIFVKVKKNWENDKGMLSILGYSENSI